MENFKRLLQSWELQGYILHAYDDDCDDRIAHKGLGSREILVSRFKHEKTLKNELYRSWNDFCGVDRSQMTTHSVMNALTKSFNTAAFNLQSAE